MVSKRLRFSYTQEEINSRFIDHWEFAEDFLEGMLQSFGKNEAIDEYSADENSFRFFIDTRRLFLAVDSTYQDIARYKDYHQSNPWVERLDCTKRCAYFLKWIPRFKPISIHKARSSNEQLNDTDLDRLELLNEFLAIYLFELHLSDEIGIDIALSDEKLRHFAYDLLYRNISKDGWISILQLIKESCFPKFIKGVPFVSKL